MASVAPLLVCCMSFGESAARSDQSECGDCVSGVCGDGVDQWSGDSGDGVGNVSPIPQPPYKPIEERIIKFLYND